MSRLALAAVVAAVAAPAAGAAPSPYPAAGTLVRATVVARAAPSRTARAVKTIHQFRPDFRPQIVLAVARRTGSDGRPWLELELPMRPNGTTGWIPAAAASVSRVHLRIVVHRGLRRLDLFRDGKLIDTTRVAVGMPGAETPLGHFYAAALFEPTDPFYGPFGIEASAYSRLSDWPGGGVVGIHGTSMPWLIGQAVSHGCVRVPNDAALRLKREVRLGTVIDIVPR